ncbi:NFACT RNA binding domain-containing protein [uncultured Acetobacterium sp.]|uniref:Rqc2 family fibronectin-binding protein n=1 Tax=uncultured Acetobacterium sp. TaxID=217139 RepID=UPI0025FA9EDF|nr:NFACT RNA binding domain-containing protein [uncultured Acetobacterium sp.]
MAYDGVTLYHLIEEFKPLLIGGRIRKVFQPELDEIRLLINHGNQKHHLLLSANASNPRAYLTEKVKENPSAPPNFCMVLRKYILNGTLVDIAQHQTDRIMELSISSKNEFNETVIRKILVEIMGRNSNIILVDESMKILDSMKKVGSTSSRYRQILPGRDYIYPPENNRHDFLLDLGDKHFDALLANHRDLSVEKFFIQTFLGISPNIAKEIAFRSGIDPNANVSDLTKKHKQFLSEGFTQVIAEIEQVAKPMIIYIGRKMVDFSTVDLHYLRADHRYESYPSISEMLEQYYFKRDKALRFKTRAANLRQQLDILVKKNIKKLDNLQQDVESSHKSEKFKLYGDLITANIYAIEKGQEIATLVNYYDPDAQTLDIPLKVNRTPAQNAQHYYKKYNKSKIALKHLVGYILETEEKIYYLESLVNSLNQSTELAELDEIRHEFLHSEFNKKALSKEDKQKQLPSKPLHYLSSEGFHIFVGKNNYQNDFISTKMGKSEDCWLHVKDAPGSHVLIVAGGRFITEKTLLEAGNLAAWYSKSRGSSNVPVDYLEFKHLKKPSKAKPGMVIFTNQNTMYVTPTQDGVEAMTVITDSI